MKVIFKDDKLKNKIAFNRHVDDMIAKYKRVKFLNLLSQQDKE